MPTMTSSALSLAGPGTDIRDAALRYWSDFGWPVRTTHAEVVLSLQPDLLAVAIPADRGAALLSMLDSSGARGGVVSLRGENERWWAFLVTPPEQRRAPTSGVWVFSEGTDIPLPHGPLPVHGVAWVREPIPGEALFDGDVLLDAVDARTGP
ncbi:hypothetical protein DMC63_34505 [Streptomyces sp. WAC 05977]|nr:hypothetical protein DMC63_34505 [Streptomyces sp. WAC 05977]